jgi:diguanylate cyclase (GGDEF)-like protein
MSANEAFPDHPDGANEAPLPDRRDESAARRDETAELRGRAADDRDQLAAHRDEAADRRDQAEETPAIAADALNRLTVVRREAASDRSRASEDRRAAASDRRQAEVDRLAASADREACAREREAASIDDLTGVYLRGAGLVELEREIARARRTNQQLVLAFVDVDRLKAINDSLGHAAGDRLLTQVAGTVRAKLRSYDLIVRYGGDEFVCAISGMNMADASERLALVNAALAESPAHGSVTVGLAELQPDDSPEALVARADAELYRERREE